MYLFNKTIKSSFCITKYTVTIYTSTTQTNSKKLL